MGFSQPPLLRIKTSPGSTKALDASGIPKPRQRGGIGCGECYVVCETSEEIDLLDIEGIEVGDLLHRHI